jgi:hypothetical protein
MTGSGRGGEGRDGLVGCCGASSAQRREEMFMVVVEGGDGQRCRGLFA